jgi:DNA-binding NtrC family response regulator
MSDEATRTIAVRDPGSFRIHRLRLKVVAGPDKGLEFDIDQRISTVGSGWDAEVRLSDGAVSRSHCRIEATPVGYLLVDEESKNGTFLDGLRVERVYLKEGAELRLGETALRVLDSKEAVDIAVSGSDRFGDMLGGSLAMREVFGILERVAPTDATVLIEGESGTGKEVAAREVHKHSKRRNGPFVVFDCGAVPRELIESELFGHVKGAFTGAVADRKGAFANASGGTLFLDEIGELDLDLQPKLLRALESREVRPVGSPHVTKVDVRVVCATNRNLKEEVVKGQFREDLYYRIAVIRLKVPPLRTRREDIPGLVRHFIESLSKEHGRKPIKISYESMVRLQGHPWRGNVRELRNFIERTLILTDGAFGDEEFLSEGIVPMDRGEPVRAAEGEGATVNLSVRIDEPFKDVKERLLEEFERAYWRRMLEMHQGNITRAAKASGVHRKSLEYLIKKYDLKNG